MSKQQKQRTSVIKRRYFTLVILLFCFGIISRGVYFAEYFDSPFLRAPVVDSAVYHHWALDIVGGRGMDRGTFRGVFTMSPGYPLFLAAIYLLGGGDPVYAVIAQALIGLLSACLLYRLGREIFSPPVALIALGLYFFSGIFIFYEFLLLLASLYTCFNLLLFFLLFRWHRNPAPGGLILAGLLAGITALLRPSTLLLIPFVLPWIFLAAGANSSATCRLSWRSLWAVVIFLTCFSLPLVPVAGRNYLRGRDFNLVTFAGGPGFLLGNGPGANGTLNIEALRSVGVETADPENMFWVLAGIVDDARGREARPSEISNYCYRVAFQTIASSPGLYLKLLLRKFLLFVNALEIGSNYDYYLARENSLSLRFGFLDLGLIFPLAFLGMILGWKQKRKLYLLYVFTGQFIVFALLFYVISRYRFPILPFLLLFTAFGVWEMIGFLRRGQRGRFLLFAGLLVPMYLLVNRDPGLGRLSNPYYNLGAAYTVQKQYQPALAAYREALKISPSDYRIYYNLGNIHYDLGEWDQSVRKFQEALKLNADFTLARHNLATALARSHRYTEAIAEYHHLLRSTSEDPEIYYNLSLIYRNLGEEAAAEAHYRQYWELEFRDR